MFIYTQHKSPNVGNVLPRNLYSAEDENKAWRGAIEMARGRIHPTYVFGNRRILGLTQGLSPFSPDVRCIRFSPRATWSEKIQAKQDMLYMAWNDVNNLVSDLTNGKFGRTYYMKTSTSAGIANNWYDLWPVTGNPASGSISNTAYTATTTDDTTSGAINHNGNVSTDTKHLLSKWAISSANTPMLLIYDRVLAYDQCAFNAASNKVLTNVSTAARYNSGAPGLLISFVVNTTTGATGADLTQMRYTNQSGTTLQVMPTATTVTFIPSATQSSTTLGARVIVPSTSGASTTWGFSLPLATGDTGARLVNDFTTSAANTGSFSIVLMAPLADLMIPVSAVPVEVDCVFQTSELTRIYDGACVSLMAFQPVASAYTLQGSIRYGWGSH